MSYSAAAVANAFIDIAADNGFYLTNLKLQKLDTTQKQQSKM